MNKQRRKDISQIYEELQKIKDQLELVLDEENEAKENYPENLHQSERYEAMEEACYNLEEALSGVETAIDYLGDIE